MSPLQPHLLRALAWLTLALALAWPAATRAAGGCSPYLGQMVINEVRIGKSKSADVKNQIEFYNVGNVPAAVWQTWRIVAYGGDSLAKATYRGTYAMSSGFTANGLFVYNSNVKLWARNGDNNNKPRASDFAVLDANGDFVAYIAIGAGSQATPVCLGSRTVIKASAGGDATGDVMRQPDGGAWPAAVTKTTVHTIGRTNACTNGNDLNVTIDVNYTLPTRTTSVVYTVNVFNNSCANNIAGVELTVTNLSGTYFNSPSISGASGSTSYSGGNLVWNLGTVNAGVARTLTFTGLPKNLGPLATTASATKPTTGLVNTGDDSDSVSIDVQPYNWVSFDVATDSLTEGTDTSYSAQVDLNVPSTTNKSVTVNYSVSGTAGAGDTNLPASGSVTIPAGETSATIDFTITNDSSYEPTKAIVLTITSVTSTDAEARLDNAAATSTITLYDDDPLSVDHYELSLPSTSLACLPSTVTVTACADASSPCTNRATTVAGQSASLTASAGTLGAASVTFDANGLASTTLRHAAAANGTAVSVSLSGETVAAGAARRCCPNGTACAAANSCSTTFNTAGFIVSAAAGGAAATLPSQTAGTSSGNYVLRAVRSGSTTSACEAALTGATSVSWSYTCNNPTTCSAGNRLTLTGTPATAITGNPNGSSASSTAVTMNFDANGNAPFSFTYADVGQITLNASKAAGGALLSALSGATNAFVVKPAGFTLSSIRCSSYTSATCATAAIASPGNNPGAANAAGTAFMPAGQPFSATVTAVDAAGNATPNYGREVVPEGVSLAASLVAPAAGAAPALVNPSGFGSFAGGSATGTGFAWGEAGIISLQPSVADGNYLGAGNVAGSASGNVGRFVPNHFTVGVTPACAASFTYAGQPMAVTLTARNAAGAALANYGGTRVAKAVTLSDAGALGVGALSGATVAANAFTAGVASASPSYTFTDKLTGPRTLTLRATDADGVSSSGFSEGSTLLRSGRLRVANAVGSDKAALQLPVLAEYWSGNAWVPNGADSCTSVPATAVAFSNLRDGRGNATGAWTTTASAISIAAGSGTLTLSAPSPAGGNGTLDLAINLGSTGTDQSCLASHPATTGAGRPWLRSLQGACAATADRDPSARASFGVYAPETRKTVHVREIF